MINPRSFKMIGLVFTYRNSVGLFSVQKPGAATVVLDPFISCSWNPFSNFGCHCFDTDTVATTRYFGDDVLHIRVANSLWILGEGGEDRLLPFVVVRITVFEKELQHFNLSYIVHDVLF